MNEAFSRALARHPAPFVTHARTLRELRDEFLADIARRQAALARESAAGPTAGIARLQRAREELDLMAEYWSSVELRAERAVRRAEAKDA